MDLTTQQVERLARQTATEAHLCLTLLWVECDSNLTWEITFGTPANMTVTLMIDAHDMKDEDQLHQEIARQLLRDRHPPRPLASPTI